MDMTITRRLNRQGLLFVGVHSLIVLNLALEMLLM